MLLYRSAMCLNNCSGQYQPKKVVCANVGAQSGLNLCIVLRVLLVYNGLDIRVAACNGLYW